MGHSICGCEALRASVRRILKYHFSMLLATEKKEVEDMMTNQKFTGISRPSISLGKASKEVKEVGFI